MQQEFKMDRSPHLFPVTVRQDSYCSLCVCVFDCVCVCVHAGKERAKPLSGQNLLSP